MKKFKFPLETVLSYKNQVLDAQQVEYAQCVSLVNQQEEVLQRLWQAYYDYNDEYRRRCGEGMAILEARASQERLRAMERDIQRATDQLAVLRKRAEAKRLEVVESKKDTSSLEKLREKQWGAYQAAQAKSEELMIEEFVMTTRSMERAAGL